jgi:hypothetical protein
LEIRLSSREGIDMQGISGHKQEAIRFLVLLADQLAAEVINVGLLDALIHQNELQECTPVSMGLFDLIREQDLGHMRLLERSIRILGGNLTTLSPRAGRRKLGSDWRRRTLRAEAAGLADSIEIILSTELCSEIGWEGLAPLAGACLGSLAWEFRGVLLEKQEHVKLLRRRLLSSYACAARRSA